MRDFELYCVNHDIDRIKYINTGWIFLLYDLMDFNKAFQAYDTIEGANCLTASNSKTQQEAAAEAVRKVGLNQISEIQPEWFLSSKQKEMFFKSLEYLKGIE